MEDWVFRCFGFFFWVFRFIFVFFYLWFMAVKQKGEAAKRPRGGAGHSQAAAGRSRVAPECPACCSSGQGGIRRRRLPFWGGLSICFALPS